MKTKIALIVFTAGNASHRQSCPARGKNCKNCGIANQFAKVYQKSKIPIKSKPRVNNVDDTSSEAATIGSSVTVGEQVNQIESMIQKHSIYDANYDSDDANSYYDDFDENCVSVISDSENIRQVGPENMLIRFVNTETKALVDLGSLCSIIIKI